LRQVSFYWRRCADLIIELGTGFFLLSQMRRFNCWIWDRFLFIAADAQIKLLNWGQVSFYCRRCADLIVELGIGFFLLPQMRRFNY